MHRMCFHGVIFVPFIFPTHVSESLPLVFCRIKKIKNFLVFFRVHDLHSGFPSLTLFRVISFDFGYALFLQFLCLILFLTWIMNSACPNKLPLHTLVAFGCFSLSPHWPLTVLCKPNTA